MPTPKRGPRIGSGPAHQKQMMAGLASDLFRHGRIRTTEAKAKTLRPYAEKLITKAKAGDLHARRQVLSKLHDRDVTAYLFEDVAPRFAERNGGYTRILKLGPRAGDSAPMVIIELVDLGEGSGDETIEEGKAERSRGLFGRRRRRAAAPAQDAALDVTPDDEESDDSDDSDDSEEESEGLEAQAPDEGPAEAPEAPKDTATTAPDDPSVGAPTEDVPEDVADAGESSGKDAGA